MKRLAAVFIAAAGLLMAAPVMAAQFISEENVAKVESGQTINDDLFLAGETIIIDGTVNGDVYAAGEAVVINGTVNGDVYAFAGKVEIKGTIRDDLVAAAQAITITGAVGDSVTVAGETITAEKSAGIGGGVLAAGSALTIRSAVGRGITAAAGEISLDGQVGRSVLLAASTITLNSATKIMGDLKYQSEESLIKNQGSEITGQTVRLEELGGKKGNNAYEIRWGFVVWSLISSALVGLILMRLMPTAMPAIAGAITGHPLPVLAWGLAVMFIAPPILILLLVSIIGIPLAILGAILFFVILYLSNIFTALAIGNIIATRIRRPVNTYALFISGLVLLMLVSLIPVVGTIVAFMTVLLGLGGVVYYTKSRLQIHPKAAKPVKPKA